MSGTFVPALMWITHTTSPRGLLLTITHSEWHVTEVWAFVIANSDGSGNVVYLRICHSGLISWILKL